MMENLEVILGFLLLYQIGPHSSLTITSLDFPRDVTLGQSVTMTCNFMVRPRQELDSIKWYKDSQEFYRKMLRPEVSVKELFFATPGVKIDKGSLDFMFTNATNAGHHRLTIQHADLTSQGNYRCQITESRNPFHTEQIDQELMVISIPYSGPIPTLLASRTTVMQFLVKWAHGQVGIIYRLYLKSRISCSKKTAQVALKPQDLKALYRLCQNKIHVEP